MKLQIEPVPSPLWNQNLRFYLPKSRWQKIRRNEIDRRGMVCETCGKAVEASRSLHAHEDWEYDDNGETGTARLQGLKLSCWHCHMSEHWGRLELLSSRLPRALPDTIAHFCRVNGVTEEDLLQHKSEAFEEWRRRNAVAWSINWGSYSDTLLEYYIELPRLDWFS